MKQVAESRMLPRFETAYETATGRADEGAVEEYSLGPRVASAAGLKTHLSVSAGSGACGVSSAALREGAAPVAHIARDGSFC